MSYKQKAEPIYEVICDRCSKNNDIPGQWVAYKKGYRQITISIGGLDETAGNSFAGVTIWLCRDCKLDFDQMLQQYLTYFEDAHQSRSYQK